MKEKIIYTISILTALSLLGTACVQTGEDNQKAKQRLNKMQSQMLKVTSGRFKVTSTLIDSPNLKIDNSQNLNIQGNVKVDDHLNVNGQYNISVGKNSGVRILKITDSYIKTNENNKWTKYRSIDTSTPKVKASQAEKIQKLIETSKLFSLVKNYGLEKIKNKPVFHYSVRIDPAELQILLRKINQVGGDSFNKSRMIQLYRLWKGKKMHLWIDKDSSRLVKLQSRNLPLHSLFPIKKTKAATTTIRLLNFNENLKFNRPDRAKTSSKVDYFKLENKDTSLRKVLNLPLNKNDKQITTTKKKQTKEKNKINKKLEQSGINPREVREKIENLY